MKQSTFLIPLLIMSLLSSHALAQKMIITTTSMIADTAQILAGECAEVTALMGPGVDPHLYQASAKDVRSLQKADLILYNGLSLEGELAEVLKRFSSRTPTTAVAEALPEEQLIHTPNHTDPHVWMDVTLWSHTLTPIQEVLTALGCDADRVAKNAAVYTQELTALNAWVEDSILSIPEEQRMLVTAHDAFAYYAQTYGLDIAAIQGISTASEASIADIREVADTVAARQVPAIFVESSVNPATIEAVLGAVKDRGAKTQIGGQLFSDAMGEKGTPQGTYLGMMISNTHAITSALGGNPEALPEALRGWVQRWAEQLPETWQVAEGAAP